MVRAGFAEMSAEIGLREPRDFLKLTGTVVSGHPDREVRRVSLGSGRHGFLKIEHRIPWKQRVGNLLAGNGFVSKSWSEAIMLDMLDSKGLPVPRWLAAGEADGQAFLLLEELPEVIDLPTWLASAPPENEVPALADRLADQFRQLHELGIRHGDPYANHVLIHSVTRHCHLIDWQRATRPRAWAWEHRYHDLAALSATLSDAPGSDRFRQRLLRAYLGDMSDEALSGHLRRITKHHNALRRRRHVRSKLVRGVEPSGQRLISLDEERLQITPAFLDWWPRAEAEWLRKPSRMGHRIIPLGERRAAVLTRHRHRLPLAHRWGLTRRKWISPERARMNLIHRLERYGLTVPQVLAVGDRASGSGTVDSFLLTLPPVGARALAEQPMSAELAFSVGELLRRLHQAGCFLRSIANGLAVRLNERGRPEAVLEHVESITLRRRWEQRWARRDRRRIAGILGGHRAEFKQGYQGNSLRG